MYSSRTMAGLPMSLWAVGLLGVGTGAVFALSANSGAVASAPEPPALTQGLATAAPATERAGVTSVAPAIRFRDSGPRAQRPPAQAPASDGRDLGRTLLLLALVLAAAIALVYTRYKRPGAGRLGASRKRKDLEVRSSVRVGGRWQIALVDVPGATLVVGATDKGLTLLTRLDPELGDDEAFDGLDGLTDAVAEAEVGVRTARDRSPSEQHRQDFLDRLIGQLREDGPEAADAPEAPAPPRRRADPARTRSSRPVALSAEARALRQRLSRYQQLPQDKAAS